MTGKEIFDNLVQYPLPQRAGIVDYVVYVFKKTPDDFGDNAKLFFDRFYPKHVVLRARSLEGAIKAIQAHAAANHVTQIRELVIVAHGAATELYPQVIEDLTDSTDKSFACITQYSLAALQAVFQAGSVFTAFRDARRAVCALLKADSWVSNKHPDGWGKVLHDDDLAAAIVDRVLERGRLLQLDGPSMRTKHLGIDAPAHAAAGSPEVVRISGIPQSEFPEPTPSGRALDPSCLADRRRHTRLHLASPDGRRSRRDDADPRSSRGACGSRRLGQCTECSR